MNYLIRKKEKKDCKDVAHVVTIAWNETYKGIVPDSFLEELKYNEEAISDSQSTLQNITTKITMQLLSLPLAQKIMRNVQGGLGQ